MIRPGNGQIDDQQRNPRSEIVTNASVDYQHTLPVVSERYLEAVIYNVKKQSKEQWTERGQQERTLLLLMDTCSKRKLGNKSA